MIEVVYHGGIRAALPKGTRKRHRIDARTFMEVLSYTEQFYSLRAHMRSNRIDVRIGRSLSDSTSLVADQVARWNLPAGAVVHILPATRGGIDGGALEIALISAAISIGVSLIASLLFPPEVKNEDKGKNRKSALYSNGLQTNKEGVPLAYLAGDRVFCGGNVIEGDYDYTATGGSETYSSTLGLTFGDDLSGVSSLAVQGGYAGAIPNDASLVAASIYGAKGKGGGGGNTISNTTYSDATIRFAMAIGQGQIGGLLGSTAREKAKNIFVNEVPLVDASGAVNRHGISWEERYGIAGQAPLRLTPGTSEPFSAGVDLTQAVSPGGAQLYVTKVVSAPNINRVKLDFRIGQLVSTDNKGNQGPTGVTFAADVKRAGGSWQNAGVWNVVEKSSAAFDRMFCIGAPDGANQDTDPWLFRVYRTTPDSGDDKLVNSTSFQGWVEIIDKDYTYDGTEAEGNVPTALFAAAIDMAGFNTSDKPEFALIVGGQLVRVPDNYDPVLRTYSGSWNGAWKYAVTANPVWHWLEIATSKTQGCGYPLDMFDKFALLVVAKRCDEQINGRFRYSLNKQFTDQQSGWDALRDLAQTFRAVPYFNGASISLVQDAPGSPDHIINNSHVEDGLFTYSSTPGEQQYNEVIVQWDNPDDYYRVARERYQDTDNIALLRAKGISNNGIVSKTVYKTGCTNRQEAYDFARALVWSALNENSSISWKTNIAGCAYQPGQRVLVDDWKLSGKEWCGRINSVGDTSIQIDSPITQKANTSYDALLVVNNSLSRRPISQVSSDSLTDIFFLDTSDVAKDTPLSIVANTPDAAQPTEWRVTEILESGAGEYTVNATRHIEAKFAWIDDHVPVTFEPWSQVQVVMPQPGAMLFTPYSYMDDQLGAAHGIDINWPAINAQPQGSNQGLALAGYLLEVQRPNSSTWEQIVRGADNFANLLRCDPGTYRFSLRSISILGRSSSAQVQSYTLTSDGSSGILPPIFEGFA